MQSGVSEYRDVLMSTLPTVPVEGHTSLPLKLILVVEHDLDFGVCIVQAIKQKTPYKAILATSEITALNIVQHLQCDLFLLDSMNGFELYDRLHATKGYEGIPALFLYDSTFIERHFAGYSKLIDLETLLRSIRSLLDPENEDFSFYTPNFSQ